ncbi:unnamed protein product [Thelazia callipaeda]|uniref:Chitin-binding type-2 domain-containing protein n=1 Tax=Thelazia callipaeda TaxID=103827 RepID=A0A0N5CPM8_THECL|nr:unnamed protein product [Thelazia callipaeda]
MMAEELNSVTTANFVTTFKIESTTTIPHDIDGNKEFGRRCPISSGLFPHPFSAQKYILCLFGSLYVMTCPPNCRFNSHILACTFKYPFAAEPNNFRCLDESDFWHPAPKGSDNPWHPTPRRTDNPWYYNPRGIDNPWHPTPRRTDNPWYYNPRGIDNPWHPSPRRTDNAWYPSPRRTDNAWYPSPRRTDNAWHPTPRRTDNTWYHDQIGTGIWYHNPRGIENPSNPIQIDNLWNTIRSRTDDSWSLIAREPDDFKNQTVNRAHTSWNSFPREPDYIPDHRYHQAGHKIKLPVSEAHRLLQS